MEAKPVPYATCDISFKTGDKRIGWSIHHLGGVQSQMTWTSNFDDETYDGNGRVTIPGANKECSISGAEQALWDAREAIDYYPVINNALPASMPRFAHDNLGKYK